MNRFFVESQAIQADNVVFNDQQARQIWRVLRMKPGDPLETRDRGFIYEQLDCPRFAADDFEYFIEQCPDDPVADVLKVQLAALDLSPKPLH